MYKRFLCFRPEWYMDTIMVRTEAHYLWNFRTFSPHFSLSYTSTFRRNATHSLRHRKEARPDTLIGRDLGAVRALWGAWRALKVFFSGGSG